MGSILSQLVELSRELGRPEYDLAIAGEGNTSARESADTFWVKASGILGLTWLHHLFGRWRVAFAEDRNRRSARTFRIANEAPTLALIVIVFMVIVKPF